MKNNQPPKQNDLKIHVIPPQISDEDISALFNGIINVVKKKFELEKNAETINLNFSVETLKKQLHEKQSEINRF